MAATSGREPLLTGQGHQTTPASAVNSGSSGREQKEHLFNEVELWVGISLVLLLSTAALVLTVIVLIACSPSGFEGDVYLLSASLYANSTSNATGSTDIVSDVLTPFQAGSNRTLEVRVGYFGIRAWAADKSCVGSTKCRSWSNDIMDPVGLLKAIDSFRKNALPSWIMIISALLIIIVFLAPIILAYIENFIAWTGESRKRRSAAQRRRTMRWFLVLLAVPAFVAAFVAFFAATWQYAATKAAADLLNSTFILTSQPNGRFALNARRGIADRLAWWAAGCMIGASILTVGLNAMERTVQGTNGRRAIEMKAQEKTTKSGGQQSTDAIAQAEDPRQYNGF